jgi:PPE-repeat protein
MAIIYRKTAKGVAEIETRAHRLPPRMRSALILVDGKRSDAVLATMIQQQATETLHALAGQGFIEVLAVAAGPAAAAPVAAPAAPAPLAAAPVRPVAPPAAQAAAGAAPDWQARRREAVRAVNDLLGPTGESVALRMERARSVDELRLALSSAVQTIFAARGRQAAEAFVARFSDV